MVDNIQYDPEWADPRRWKMFFQELFKIFLDLSCKL